MDKIALENKYAAFEDPDFISFKKEFPSEQQVRDSWERHLQTIQNLKEESPSFKWSNVLKMAAIFGGVILIAAAYLFVTNNHRTEKNIITVKTAFGEMRHLTLPDGSTAVLNANSKIKYTKNADNKREVWMEGEVLFDVKHLNKDTNNISAQDLFKVHSKDMTVTVLGTSFDIRQRRERTEIVLQRGKIKISFKDTINADIYMQPGDMINYDHVTGKIVHTLIPKPEKYTAWADKKLELIDPSVNEIIAYLEDNFGKKIILQDQETGAKKIQGPILVTSLDEALFILSTILNTEIVKKDSATILLNSR